QLHAGPRSEALQGLGKADPVALHHEIEDVASLAAPEALPRLAAGGDHERGRLLRVERAQPLVGLACLLEGNLFADQLDDVELRLDLGSDADRQPPSPSSRPAGGGNTCRRVNS